MRSYSLFYSAQGSELILLQFKCVKNKYDGFLLGDPDTNSLLLLIEVLDLFKLFKSRRFVDWNPQGFKLLPYPKIKELPGYFINYQPRLKFSAEKYIDKTLFLDV